MYIVSVDALPCQVVTSKGTGTCICFYMYMYMLILTALGVLC